MEPSRAEKFFSNIFSAICNPLILPFCLFALLSYTIPLCRLYIAVYPGYFILKTLGIILFSALIPLFYIRTVRKIRTNISIRELLVFTLILNCITFFITRTNTPSAVSIALLGSFSASFTALVLMIIETYFSEIDIYSASAGIMALFVLAGLFFTPPTSAFALFFVVSTVLIALGLILSLLIAAGKSTIKKTIIGLITAVIAFCVSAFTIGFYTLIEI